jgi:hypothetical protein
MALPEVENTQFSIPSKAGAAKTQVENYFSISKLGRKLAEGVGFEPTVGFHPRRFSRPLP